MKKQLTFAMAFVLVAQNSFSACLPDELCARISGLTDMHLGTWGGSGDLMSNSTLCVYVQNDDENVYTASGSGEGFGGSFQITNGVNNIPVKVDYENAASAGWVTLTPSINANFVGPNTIDELCNTGGNSAKVRVSVNAGDMDGVTSGTYTGVINLSVSPD